MSTPQPASPRPSTPEVMSELRVTAHLMRLDPGLYCVVQMPTPGADPRTGLPGVRLSLPPGPSGRPDAVKLVGFHANGWLSGTGDAALLLVSGSSAQVLVTIYQALDAKEGTSPNLQVRRVFEAQPAAANANGAAAAKSASAPAGAGAAKAMEMMAHVQGRGDVGAMIGEWLGERGSRRWIEGFGIAPGNGVTPADMEYQAVLGPGWLSPWVEGGQFCGSRGMALPVLGLRARLRGEAASRYRLSYAATFVDGTEIGPVAEGEPCEAASLAAMESFQVALAPRVEAAGGKAARPVAAAAKAPAKAAQVKAAPAKAAVPAPVAKVAAKTSIAKAQPARVAVAPAKKPRR